jgi:hypothetical protein
LRILLGKTLGYSTKFVPKSVAVDNVLPLELNKTPVVFVAPPSIPIK